MPHASRAIDAGAAGARTTARVRGEPARLRRPPARLPGCALLVAAALAAGARAQELAVEWETPKSLEVTEGKNVTLKLTVTNGTVQTLTTVAPVDLGAAGSGNATWWRWPKPAFVDLAPGESQTFKIAFRAQLPGFVTFSGRAQGYDPSGDAVTSEPADTDEFFVRPGKLGTSAESGALGFAVLKIGGAQLALRLVDEDSGSPIAGLSAAVAKMKQEPGRVVVAIADAAGRYPLQLLEVRGPPAARPGDSEAELPPYVEVPLASGAGTLRAGPIRVVETPLLPPVAPPDAVDTREADAVVKVLKTLAKSKQPLPPPFAGNKAKIIKPTVAAASAFGLDSLREQLAHLDDGGGLSGAFVASGVEQFPNAHDVPIGGIALVDLADPLIDTAPGWVYPGDDFLEIEFTRLAWGDEIFVVAGTRVAKGFDAASVPADPPPAAVVAVTASESGGDGEVPAVTLTGVFEAASTDVLGLAKSAPLDAEGTALVNLTVAAYDTAVHRPGYEPGTAVLDLTLDGGGAGADGDVFPFDVPQDPRSLCSGVVSVEEEVLTTLLDAGDDFTATPTFFDCDGTVVAVEDPVRWHVVSGPKGSIATVDDGGTVTIDKGCGAGWVTAWHDGVQCAPWQFDTSCNDTLPPLPPPPKTLTDDDLVGFWVGAYTLDYEIDNIFCGEKGQLQLFEQSGQMSLSLGVTDSPSDDYDVVFGTWSMSNIATIAGPPECVSSTTETAGGSVQGGKLEEGVFTGTLVLPDLSVSFSIEGDDEQLDGTWTDPAGATGSFTLTRGPF